MTGGAAVADEGRAKILVVDDDAVLLKMIEVIIGGEYTVTTVSSGADALIYLNQAECPDIILLDIDMPGMDGFETFQHIRTIQSCALIPIVFLTAVSGDEPELKGLSLGAKDYITKPFVRDIFLTRIRLRLEDGKKARALEIMKAEMNEKDSRFEKITSRLSPLERKIAGLVRSGLSNREIADKLGYSYGYVRNTTSIILDKLELHSRRELRELLSD
jgi:DNA-binding NarL/FixJ family response regulator